MNSWRATPPRVVAHRGASHRAPENTFAAFDLALEEGADAFEFDVRLTADGVPIVMHDRSLERVTGRPGLVDRLTARDLEAYRVEGREVVPRLEDVLRRYKGRARFDVELKSEGDAPAPLVAATWRAAERAGVLDDILLTSFDPFAAAAWREAGGLAGLLVLDPPLAEEAAAVAHAFDALLPPAWELSPDAFAPALNAGLLLYVWTVNDPAYARALLDLGVTGVITDTPRAVRAAL